MCRFISTFYSHIKKLFLSYTQSDDPPVVRTCYSAMRHTEGDVIKPRDCVLLRASNKRNELPYVAKVASLWENPEDGQFFGRTIFREFSNFQFLDCR